MDRIYLDANATTPVAPEVVEAMLPFLTTLFGNPSSAHAAGQRTRSAVEHARAAVATLLQALPKEIVFTSGGTESNNLALSGILQPYLDRNEPAHLITAQTEHHAVLYAAESLERRGIAVTYLAPDANGLLDPAALEAALRPDTRLVSIMLANNETGVIQPLGKLARIAKSFNTAIIVHTDAVQAAGKLPIDLTGEFKNVDLLSLSGHKFYAPQGTGALFVRKGVQLAPLFHGGPHERQRRAGTENVSGIVALGRAATLASAWLTETTSSKGRSFSSANNLPLAGGTSAPDPETQLSRSVSLKGRGFSHANNQPIESGALAPEGIAHIRDTFERRLLTELPQTQINAANSPRVPNTTNILFEGIDAEALLIALDMQGIAASFGAACQSGATEPSHVLLAMGLTQQQARSSLRFSFLRSTTPEEAAQAADIIIATVERLRSLI